MDIILSLCRGISKAIAVSLPLHLGIQILLEVVFVAIVELMEEVLILEAQDLILK
jgi:hypothetical protein